jgi:hypothetical protein
MTVRDSCSSQPCLNNATCVRSSIKQFGYSCLCLKGFEGVNCERASVKPPVSGKFEILLLNSAGNERKKPCDHVGTLDYSDNVIFARKTC